MDYKSLLNEEQYAPVAHTEGAVLVLAGAGSGKTRVLTYRIAYLLNELNVSPYNILAITFTNKAAAEMKSRVEAVTNCSNIWISTFHSMCSTILRYDIDKIGYTSNFTIYDTADSDKLLRRICKSRGIDDKGVVKRIKSHISGAKNQGFSAEDYAEICSDEYADEIIKVFAEYDAALKANNALDFDDLLIKTVNLFIERPDVLTKYQERFMYVHVDEFQDTNKLQYLLVRMLSHKYRNLFVVGDDDQSIYGWRGAEVENMRNVLKHFSGAKVYKLQRNYRSSGKILECANNVIRHNSSRMGKELWTESKGGVPVVFNAAYDDKSEADWVLGVVKSLVNHNGYSPSDIAILVRANSLTRNFEEKMNLYSVPYKVYGGFKFFDRKEVKDMIAYLRLAVNCTDNEAIARVINFPKRGIGETTLNKLMDFARIRNESVYGIMQNINSFSEFNSAAKRKLEDFCRVVTELKTSAQKGAQTFADELEGIIKLDDLVKQNTDEELNRYENAMEFIASIKEFFAKNPDTSLSDYLQSVALIADADTEAKDCLSIATVHAVKGLEFKAVFIAGLEEKLFPSSRDGSTAEIEEERRIMYVALTRAKERLYLSCAGRRNRFGTYEQTMVSRFVKETGIVLPEEKRRREESPGRVAAGYAAATLNKNAYLSGAAEKKESVAARDTSVFKTGQNVFHARFGEGIIIAVNGDNADIKFSKLGVKTFALRLAPLTLIE